MDTTTSTTTKLVLGPDDGQMVQLYGLGIRFMLEGDATGGQFSLVEHPLAPKALGAGLHTHTNEDEYSYVLEGEVTVQIGEEIVVGHRGDLILKPRGTAHAFWNAGDEPARILEIISPAGFEQYFKEIDGIFAPGIEPDVERFLAISERYGLEFDLGSEERIAEEYGLEMPV